MHLICSRIAYLQRSGHVVLSDRDVSTRPCFVQPIEPFYEDYMFAYMVVEPRNDDGSRLTPLLPRLQTPRVASLCADWHVACDVTMANNNSATCTLTRH